VGNRATAATHAHNCHAFITVTQSLTPVVMGRWPTRCCHQAGFPLLVEKAKSQGVAVLGVVNSAGTCGEAGPMKQSDTLLCNYNRVGVRGEGDHAAQEGPPELRRKSMCVRDEGMRGAHHCDSQLQLAVISCSQGSVGSHLVFTGIGWLGVVHFGYLGLGE
jgi:hypothetical protein